MAKSNETHTEEEQERIDAVNRHQRGERPSKICKSLGRSRSWLQKWVGRYNRQVREDGAISVLNEDNDFDKSLAYEYAWATLRHKT